MKICIAVYRGAHAVFLAVRGLDKTNILHRDRDRAPRHGKNITALRGMGSMDMLGQHLEYVSTFW